LADEIKLTLEEIERIGELNKKSQELQNLISQGKNALDILNMDFVKNSGKIEGYNELLIKKYGLDMTKKYNISEDGVITPI